MLKRNTITALWMLFMAVTETTVSQTALTECDPQKCVDKLIPGVNCRTVPEAIDCAETTILPNPECSQDVKDQAREEIQKGEDYIREHCQVNEPTVTQTTPTVCGYQQCLDILRRLGVHCGTVPVAIECANTIVLPNPQCSESVKDETRRKIQEGEEYIREHCQGGVQP